MLKKKYLIVSIIMMVALFVLGTRSFAAEENSGITYTREFPSNDGTIVVNFNGLELEETGVYQYGLTTQGGEEPEEWYDIAERTETTATVTLSGSSEKMNEVLAKTNNGIVWIKKSDADNSTAIKVNVDLTLAVENAVSITNVSNGIRAKDDYSSINGLYKYGYYSKRLETTAYQFMKITDAEIMNKWLEHKENNSDIKIVTDLINEKIPVPSNGYTSGDTIYSDQFNPRKDGLYLIWISLTGDGYKTVYGYVIYDGLYETGKTLTDYNLKEETTQPTTPSTDTTPTTNPTPETTTPATVEPLTATVSYSTTGSIIATIKTNKKVEAVSGWTLSADGKTLTKEYTENKTETVKVKDTDGQTKEVEVKVTNIVKNATAQNGKKLNGTESKNLGPQAGASLTIVAVVIGVMAFSVVMAKKAKKYRGIK